MKKALRSIQKSTHIRAWVTTRKKADAAIKLLKKHKLNFTRAGFIDLAISNFIDQEAWGNKHGISKSKSIHHHD